MAERSMHELTAFLFVSRYTHKTKEARPVTVYLDIVILLNFLIDWLLLLGTNRLCGYSPGWGRAAVAAGVGGVYAGCCFLPGFVFLGNWLWRIVSLLLMSWIAFGFSISALRRGVVFTLLSMALGGVALGMGTGGFWQLVLAAAAVALMCMAGFRGKLGIVNYIPIEITFGGKQLHITALQDTGNGLRDPVTGRPVLVVGGDVAMQLTGLTDQQLRQPLEVMTSGTIPGLRLVPYRAVGQPCGMLLAIRIPEVKIGDVKQSTLVAFAPDRLSREGAYQALTGGAA